MRKISLISRLATREDRGSELIRPMRTLFLGGAARADRASGLTLNYHPNESGS